MELSVREGNVLRQSLVTKAILSPKLLIKYQNTINKKREPPEILVIPATNFTATLSNIGYLEIK